MEKECFSNTLKIEADEAAVLQKKSALEVVVNNEAIATDKDSNSDNDSPDAELSTEHGAVSISNINASDVIPEDYTNVYDVKSDTRPKIYHDCLQAIHVSRSRLVNDEVSIKGSGGEITWKMIQNHTKPELSKESKQA